MTSYAQNFEDVMLWRALKHIKKGFYVDVGAWMPNLDSVTQHFYEKGWRGINIEPNPLLIRDYRSLRPRDINLPVAISNEKGKAEFYFIDDTGLSSLDKKIINAHNDFGYEAHASQVEVTTLADIFFEHCKNVEIHFLKIDIEGYEKQAILGNNWEKFRPWIVVVEATLPMSQIENHHEWEHILLKADYQFAYADGLNRFYVAKEHSELLDSFKYPPNVFDEFILLAQEDAQQDAIQANAKAAQAQQELIEANAKAAQAQQEAAQAWEHYFAVVHSRSWKLTKPLRLLTNFVKTLAHLPKKSDKSTEKDKAQKLQNLSPQIKAIYQKIKQEQNKRC